MITLLLGKPGSGKSHEAVETYVLPNLKKGRKIITNLPLNETLIYEVFPDVKEKGLLEIKKGTDGQPYDAFSSPDDFIDEWRDEKTNQGAMIIVDEAHFCLDRNLSIKKLKPIEDWFSVHRQHGSDVVLITQTEKKITTRVLQMCEIFIRVRKLGLFGGVASVFRGGADNMYIKHTLSSLDKGEKPIKSEQKKYKSSVHKFYNSHLMAGGAVVESNDFKVSKIALIKNTWWFWLICLMVLYLCYKIFLSGDSVNPFEPPKKTAEISKSVGVPPSQNPKKNIREVPTGSPFKKTTKIKKSVKGVSPLKNFDLFIDGSYYENRNIIFSFLVEDPSFEQFKINTKQLYDMGYQVLTFGSGFDINPCIVIIKYLKTDETQYVYCKKQEEEINNDSDNVLPDFSFSSIEDNEGVKE